VSERREAGIPPSSEWGPSGPAAKPTGADMTDINDAAEPDPLEDPAAAEAEQFTTDLHVLQRERDDLLDTTRRLQADFENYRKRVLREQTALVERATEGLLEQLLPVLDSFELAVTNLDGSDVDEKVRKGIELVFAELTAVLERAGLEKIDALGAPFDPNEHEAVMQDDGDGEPHVGGVLRTGWKLKGRVLRPAMVKVSRA
jgi:molecular chaperone GrpE